ncbi:zinc finger Y-chromosomal protein 1-like [Haematobia irritans]|uniref:zinc finger Y-chromosomal protein 1-like n=1 Tax=Haematobia irritans TaxID=7368 RepID=UPI003F50B701
MDTCLLCLEFSSETYITCTSKLWQEENIESLIQQHLWPLKSITSNSWLCNACWNHINEFHKFYVRIEETQKSIATVIKKEATETNCYVEPIILDNSENDNSYNNLTTSNKNEEGENALVKIENVIEEEPMLVENLPENKLGNTDPLEKPLPSKYPRRKTRKQIQPKNKTIITEEKESEDITRVSNIDENSSSPEDIHAHSDTSDSDSDENETDIEEPTTKKNASKSNVNPDYRRKTDSHEMDQFVAKHFKIICVVCQSAIPTFHELRRHFVKQHNEPGYAVCCDKKFFKCSDLIDHIQCHLNPEHFKCKHCGKILSGRRCLKFHVETHGITEKTYVCDICNRAFSRKIGLKNHKLVHLSDEEKKFACKQCGKPFGNANSLSNHERVVHLKKTILVCDICGEKLRGKDVLERHILKHQGVPLPTISCDVCGLKVTTQRGLKRHKESQHPEGGKQQYPCHLCSKISPTLKAQKKHIKDKHELGYDFKCTLCDKAYKRSSALKEHMASHTGSILYTCSYCPKTFNSNANMHSHRKKAHPLEWEEECREKYSGNLPPKCKLNKTKSPDEANWSQDRTLGDHLLEKVLLDKLQ